VHEIETAPDEQQQGDAEADDDNKNPLLLRRERRGGDADLGESGEMEILEGQIIFRDRFALSPGKDDSEDRLQDEEQDTIEDPGKNSVKRSPREDAP